MVKTMRPQVLQLVFTLAGGSGWQMFLQGAQEGKEHVALRTKLSLPVYPHPYLHWKNLEKS